MKTVIDNKNGFTMIELLVALGISSILVTAIAAVYVGMTKAYSSHDVIVGIHQDLRAVSEYIGRDLRMAAYNEFKDAPTNLTGDLTLSGGNTKFTEMVLEATATKFRYVADLNSDRSITNSNEEQVTYIFDSGNRKITKILYEGADPQQDSQTLVENVAKLEFKYFYANNTEIPAANLASSLNLIRSVEMAITIDNPNKKDRTGNKITRTISTRINLRNHN